LWFALWLACSAGDSDSDAPTVASPEAIAASAADGAPVTVRGTVHAVTLDSRTGGESGVDGGDGDLTKSGGPLPLALKPGTPATVHLVIADDPAKAKEASLEILFKSEGETAAPAITLNGQPLQELKSTSAKAGFILTLSSSALKPALKRGTNDFTFTSAASVTVTSLSVRVVP
jgi:hypothetical protein